MRLTLSTDDLPERDRLPFWHDAVCQERFHVTPAPLKDASRFRAKLDVQVAGQFALAELETTHGSIEKTVGDTARGASDSVLVFLAVKEAHHYQFGRHDLVVSPGDVGILPMNQRFQCATGGIAFRSLLVPPGVLGPLMAVRELTRACHLPAATPLGALLGAGLSTAAATIPSLTPELGEAVLANLSGLVALAIGASEEGQETGRKALKAARLDEVKRHIGRHLANPLLDPASVGAAFGMSVRSLHLLFQPTEDTFAQYLLRRRLEACRATLSSPAAAGRSVADVAFGWGFNSLSVFHRAFAAAFGTSPASMRAALKA